MAQNINLIDAALLPPLERLSAQRLLAALGVGALLIALHFGWEQLALARALAMARAGVAAPATEAAASAPDNSANERLAQREALRDLLRNQVAVADGSAALIAELLQLLPAEVWLTELELGPQRSLRISGGTLDTVAFGQLSAHLTEVSALRGLPLHTLRLAPQPVLQELAQTAATAPAAHLFVLASATDTTAGATR